MGLALSRYASDQWAIVSDCGGICYEVQRTRREAIDAFMRVVNADPKRRHLRWNCPELKYAKAIKVRIELRA